MATALVLGGGGAKGYGVPAACQVLQEHDLALLEDVVAVIGTSVGALNSLVLAQGAGDPKAMDRALAHLRALWRDIGFHDVYERGPRETALKIGLTRFTPWSDDYPLGIHGTRPLRRLIEKEVRRMDGYGAAFHPVWVDLERLQTHWPQPFEAKDIVNYTLASASIPVYSDPVRFEYDGRTVHAVDGGLTDVSPLKVVLEDYRHVDRVIVINLESEDGPAPEGPPADVFDVAARSLKSLTKQVFQQDLKLWRERNREFHPDYVRIPTLYIEPAGPMPSGTDFSWVAKRKSERAMRKGAEKALEVGFE